MWRGNSKAMVSSWSEAAISSDNEAVQPANLVTPETRRRIAISHSWLQNRLKAILRSSKDAMRTTPRLQIEETARCVSQPAQVLKQPAGINIWRSKQNLDERERVGQAASEGGSDTLAQPSCARDWATGKRYLSACASPLCRWDVCAGFTTLVCSRRPISALRWLGFY